MTQGGGLNGAAHATKTSGHAKQLEHAPDTTPVSSFKKSPNSYVRDLFAYDPFGRSNNAFYKRLTDLDGNIGRKFGVGRGGQSRYGRSLYNGGSGK